MGAWISTLSHLPVNKIDKKKQISILERLLKIKLLLVFKNKQNRVQTDANQMIVKIRIRGLKVVNNGYLTMYNVSNQTTTKKTNLKLKYY